MKIIYTFLLAAFAGVVFGQYDINFKLKGYDGDTLVLGNYFADKQLVKDTIVGEKGKWKYAGNDTLASGVYFVLTTPDRKYMQFFVNDMDREFEMQWDLSGDGEVQFKGSKDNETFVEYMEFLAEQRPIADKWRARLTAADSTGVADKDAEDGLAQVDETVKQRQLAIISENPQTVTARFLRSGLSVDIPDYEGEDAQYQTYRFYKQHYFDNVDLGDPVNLRTPYLHERIDYYLEKLTPQDPDSIMISIDYLLESMEPAEETYKYYLSYFLNKYAKLKVVGYDAVYVHLIDNYYAKGKAPWVSEENLKKMIDQSNNFKPILIGKKFPDITTYKADSLQTPVRVWDVESDYTVLLFWAHDCGHCTKAMPAVVSFYEEYESKGVTLISICTKGGKKTTPCQEAVPKKKMDKFINTFDEYQRYRRKVYIPSTPKIFILDKDKKILIKDIPASELKNIMEEIMKIDQKKEMPVDKM